jgi:hypothetical protein
MLLLCVCHNRARPALTGSFAISPQLCGAAAVCNPGAAACARLPRRLLMSARRSFERLSTVARAWLCHAPSSAHGAAPGAPCVALLLARAAATVAAPRVTGAASPLLRPLDVRLPQSVDELVPPLEPRQPGPGSLRTGLIATKVGVVSEWDEHGVLTPLTVLWFDHNQVCWTAGARSLPSSICCCCRPVPTRNRTAHGS